MKTIEHTPTPWKSEGHDIVSVNPDRHIAAIIRHNPGTTVDEQIANASFIVRAVNCLEENYQLLNEIYILRKELNISDYLSARIQKAIAKAEKGS